MYTDADVGHIYGSEEKNRNYQRRPTWGREQPFRFQAHQGPDNLRFELVLVSYVDLSSSFKPSLRSGETLGAILPVTRLTDLPLAKFRLPKTSVKIIIRYMRDKGTLRLPWATYRLDRQPLGRNITPLLEEKITWMRLQLGYRVG